MKRLLLPFLAALALPTSVNAETWYLLIGKGSGIVAVEEQCEQAGEEVTTFKEWKGDGKVWFVVNCIKGK
tara:strand:+ start:271 stop:480 length:210 start_codon:yes stop_codon:yes gene_type:complete